MSPEASREFSYAVSRGWLPFFHSASQDYNFDPALLMAIASRETNMRNIVGDGGHGFGLMQIDVRSYPDFCHTGAWHNAELAIVKGALVLDSKRTIIEKSQGRALNIGGYSFLGDKLSPEILLRTAVAAYNCGLWAYYAVSKGEDIDRFTTGHNYSRDVFARQAQFAQLLKGGSP